MPRPRKPPTERWVSDIPVTLAQRANALRDPHIKWFTKALLIECALQYYCEIAERDGMEGLPPFRLVRPDGPIGLPSSGPSGMEHHSADSVSNGLTVARDKWQDYVRTGT
jgi:hypothetical protein